MAILAIFTGKGITKSHYEALRREVDWVHRRPEGMIFHAAAFDTAGGIRVADVWESQAAREFFAKTRPGRVLFKGSMGPEQEVRFLAALSS